MPFAKQSAIQNLKSQIERSRNPQLASGLQHPDTRTPHPATRTPQPATRNPHPVSRNPQLAPGSHYPLPNTH